jgi:hypothetical protein
MSIRAITKQELEEFIQELTKTAEEIKEQEDVVKIIIDSMPRINVTKKILT